MNLELSDGKNINNPSQRDIDDAISKIGSTLDHCILSGGDAYIQTAGEKGKLFIEYNKGGESFESTNSDLSVEQVQEIFRDFLAGGNKWNTMIPYQSISSGDGMETGSQTHRTQGSTSFTPGSFKQTITNTVKNEAMNSVSRMIRRFIRKLFL